MCVTQFNNNNNAHTQRLAQAVYTCSSCTSADARELVRVRSRPWVGQRSSGCECRTVIVNPSALGSGTLMAADTGRRHQCTRRTVRIPMSTSSDGLSWRGGCSADGSDTCMSGDTCMSDTCMVVLPQRIHTPHNDTHHRTMCQTSFGYMWHALWHYAFVCQQE